MNVIAHISIAFRQDDDVKGVEHNPAFPQRGS